MDKYNNFFNEFDNFYTPKRGIEFYESSMRDGLITISENLGGKLFLLRKTHKLIDLSYQSNVKKREKLEAYRNATTSEEKKRIIESLDDGDDSRVTMFDSISHLWFGECGTRKMKSLLIEQFDGDEELVWDLFVIKKLGNYSIALEKPWWHDCYYRVEG